MAQPADIPTAPSPAPAPIEPQPECPNCGHPTSGNFCSNCGQRNVTARITVRQLILEIAGDYLHIDSKLVRTAWVLVSQPGVLTRQYLDGRRERFIRPFKVYLAASVLFFGYATLGTVKVHTGTEPPIQVKFDAPDPSEPAFVGRLRASTANKTPQQLSDQMEHALHRDFPRLMFVLIPLFALLLRLLYIGSPFLYVEHFITALHINAFAFLVLFLNKLPSRLPLLPSGTEDWLSLLSIVGVMTYLAVALRRIYRQSTLISAIKSVFLVFAYGMLLAMAVAAITMTSLYFDT